MTIYLVEYTMAWEGGPLSAWTTKELAEAERDRLNGDNQHRATYFITEYKLDSGEMI